MIDFVTIPKEVLACKLITNTERIYYGYLSHFLEKDGIIEKSDKELAQILEVSESSITRMNRSLYRAGWMRSESYYERTENKRGNPVTIRTRVIYLKTPK